MENKRNWNQHGAGFMDISSVQYTTVIIRNAVLTIIGNRCDCEECQFY